MNRDPQNCPYCEAEEKGFSQPYGMSPEGMAQLKEKHIKEHCVCCPTCGQPIKQ